MSQKFLRFLLRFSVIMITLIYVNLHLHEDQENYALLLDFTCAVAKDELEKHPDMRTIAMVELENKFPSEFSREVLKCLPEDVAKIIINPHTHVELKNVLVLPKQTMVIYVAENVKKDFCDFTLFLSKNFPIIDKSSKRLIVSSNGKSTKKNPFILKTYKRSAQIYLEDGKVISRIIFRGNLSERTFEDSRHENLSQILFPVKMINFQGHQIHAAFQANFGGVWTYNMGKKKPNCKWNYFLDIIAEKFNATLSYIRLQLDPESKHLQKPLALKKLHDKHKLDFYLNHWNGMHKLELEVYNNEDWCFVVPVPRNVSIVDQILYLPLDNRCWMWLLLTIGTSTLVWRLLEGHWNFFFGAFAYFVGQPAEIRTTRLILKILLQIFIFTFFIFSNGYQSIVTSFMLDPVKIPYLRSVDELLDSNLNIRFNAIFDSLQHDNPKYQRAVSQGRIVRKEFIPKLGWWKQHENSASLHPCKMMKNRVEHEGDGKSWRGLYFIDEPVYSDLAGLFAHPSLFYIDRLQELMDQSFEAGLHQAWEKFFDLKHYEMQLERGFGRIQGNVEEHNLDLDKIIEPFFKILVVGFVAALLTLLFEIFYHDFVSQLTKEYFRRKMAQFGTREVKVSRKAKVRRVKVEPVVMD